MGYYDDHSPHTRQQKKRKSWVMPTIIGIILGAVLILLALPALIQSNLLPYDMTIPEDDTGLVEEGENLTGSTENVKVNVTTQITEVVEEVAPTVVGVVNLQTRSGFLQGEETGEAGTGSGVIYKIDGDTAYVVTNHHVIQGADEVEVVLADETRVKAKIVGSDLFTDLAVLEMSSDQVDKAIELGSSNNLKVGEPAIAIGNPLGLRFSGSVTRGIISGKQRAIPQDFNGDGQPDWQAEVIQTDAAINPGNSGGALINIKGQLIGINSMKIARSAVEGIGFAIPIDYAEPIIAELEADGKITRPFLGVEAYSLSDVSSADRTETLKLPEDVENGVYIRNIEPMSPAAKAGLKPLDVIVALDGEPIKNIIELRQHLYQKKKVGEEMKVTFYRNGEKQETTVTLASQEDF
ncbi:S1C family serine protease [Thalassobacillus pellis]|uniref:S1C family serine protease n=1 Tax=Thalassobacillus pellis TaxID=748008 RepID=UPI0019608A85|nr:trypsin-like peptidase domain-containing protein [Thalassobacillus pellis]MBM7552170.1 serine protease Do [Thalassobacillus pellis]